MLLLMMLFVAVSSLVKAVEVKAVSWFLPHAVVALSRLVAGVPARPLGCRQSSLAPWWLWLI